jgi:hypothetical protein
MVEKDEKRQEAFVHTSKILLTMVSLLCFAFFCLYLSSLIIAVPCRPFHIAHQPRDPSLIPTVFGKVSGILVDGVTRITLPYASPPTGPLRFANPQPVKQLNGHNVTKTPPSCYQGDGNLLGGNPVSEDCLYST